MAWRYNLLIIQEILCHLDFPDLLSAAAVCHTWLTASAKAFEIASCLAIPDSRPDGAAEMARLELFQRIKAFKFKLSCRGATWNGLNCILASLPLETLTTMTYLTLDYEPTAHVLESINIFLAQLTTRFPALKELQICPKADPAEDLVSPSLEFLRDNLVPSAEHSNLTVLRVPVGPNSGSGIDWRFLSCLKKLKELTLWKLHMRGGGRFLHRQLTEFATHLPAEAQIAKLNIHLRLGIQKHYMDYLHDQETMKYAFRAINPEMCTLYIEHVDSEFPPPRSPPIQKYWLTVDQIVSENLKRINIHYSVPLHSFTDETNLWDQAKALIFPLRHFGNPHQNPHVLLRIDIVSQGLPISFIELECAQFEAPLVLRHGPVGQHAEAFSSFLNYSLLMWTRPSCGPPVPRYNALRKITFNESQHIVGLAQYYPVDEKPPAFSVWQRTHFMSLPHVSSLFSGQPSWKPKLKCPQTLPVTALLVYSIDCTTMPECNDSP